MNTLIMVRESSITDLPCNIKCAAIVVKQADAQPFVSDAGCNEFNIVDALMLSGVLVMIKRAIE